MLPAASGSVHISRLTGLSGVLPSGLRYFAGGSYANSDGTRNWSDFDSYNLFTGITVQQPLLRNLWIDQGRMTIQINKQNLKITELGVAYLTMDVINQVQQAYDELLGARDHQAARQRLVTMREKFLAAQAGITGVNFAVADTGAVVVCTNEGNADMGTALPPLHVACMGLEKIVPRAEDLGVFLRLLARSATGQACTT